MASRSSSRPRSFPLTVVHIFFYSALGCLLPFLSLQARDLGLNAWECSVANLSAAALSGLGAGALFALGRACGRPKLLSVLCLLFSGLAYTGLILIPRVVRIPRHPLMEFDCSAAIRLEKCANWASCSDATLASSNYTSFKLRDCQYVCRPSRQDGTVPYPLHVCFRSDGGNFCEVYDATASAQNTTVDFQSRFPAWYFDDLRQVPASEFLSYQADDPDAPDFVDVCSYKPVWPLVVNHNNYDDIYCRPIPEGCQIKCKVFIEGDPGPSQCLELLGDPALTFWVYLGVRSAADTFLLSSAVLLDALFLLTLSGSYGRSRLWSALGLALFPPLTGYLLDYYTSFSGRPDYSPSVFIFDGLVLVTCAVVVALRLEEGRKGPHSGAGGAPAKRRPFWSLELGILLTVNLTLGGLWGVTEAFLPALFVEIGCSKLLVGVCAGLPFLCAMPFLAVAKNLVRNLGRANLLVFAFLFYAIRFAGLSFVTHPHWTFPFQAMETFTLAVAWIALVDYAHSLVSGGKRTTVHFLLYFLHFSAGRALGSCMGAFLNQVLGLPWTFRSLAIFSLVQGLLYLLLHHTCVKKRRSRPRTPSRAVSASNGGALIPLAERRPNGDALHGKDDGENSHSARPMMDSDYEDCN